MGYSGRRFRGVVCGKMTAHPSRLREATMQHFVGLDVSVKETAICVVGEQGRVVARGTVESEPSVVTAWLLGRGLCFSRIGLEAGPMSPWLYAGLVEADLPAVCVETRHMHAALSARINKTDRNDAYGIAQMMRVGLFKPVYVKTPASQRRCLLLTSRKVLQRRVQDLENDLRGSLRNFGLKVGVVGAAHFDRRLRDLAAADPFAAAVVEPLLEARAMLRLQLVKLHKMLLDLVRDVADGVDRAPGIDCGGRAQDGEDAGFGINLDLRGAPDRHPDRRAAWCLARRLQATRVAPGARE